VPIEIFAKQRNGPSKKLADHNARSRTERP